MNEIMKLNSNGKVTSLEMVKQINFFREQEGNRAELQHNDLLKVIRDEFSDEIDEGKMSPSSYKDSMNREKPMFELTLNQAKQVFVRCKAKPTKEFCDKYNLDVEYNIVSKTRFEVSFGNMLIEALKELEIEAIPQYKVGKYRVDFYIPSKNIAVEYDEQQHFTETNQVQDSQRQKYIENKLGCKFIRCDYRDSDIKNLMKILKEAM